MRGSAFVSRGWSVRRLRRNRAEKTSTKWLHARCWAHARLPRGKRACLLCQTLYGAALGPVNEVVVSAEVMRRVQCGTQILGSAGAVLRCTTLNFRVCAREPKRTAFGHHEICGRIQACH